MGSELNLNTTETSWTGISWTRQSDEALRFAEKKILSYVKTPYNGTYVDIGSVVGKKDKIWTISLNESSPKTPLVMLHGMASGVAFWCPNFDALAASRPVYAIDVLGFGRSSRPKFASDPEKVEAQWVDSLEEWRRKMNFDQIILLGHSLGGYISTAYALRYPERVKHLILADPWGFLEKPSNPYETFRAPLLVRAVATAVHPLNPLCLLRAAGPAGRWLMNRASRNRPDLIGNYQKFIPDADTIIPDYMYHCNAQTPSGESAYSTLMQHFRWAKNPMVKRVDQLPPALPITVLSGSKSWVDTSTGQHIAEHRQPDAKTYTHIIEDSGHHVYLQKPDVFNKLVLDACDLVDNCEPLSDMARHKADNSVTSHSISTNCINEISN